MKKAIMNSLPWAVRHSLRATRKYLAQNTPPFRGVYKSFDDLPTTIGYDHQDWSTNSLKVATKAKNMIGHPPPSDIAPSKSLLGVAVSTMLASKNEDEKNVRILDFGGAGGLDYGILRALTHENGNVESYHVVDVPGACEAGREVW